MSTDRVHSARILEATPQLHLALIEIVSEMNRPERDAAILDMAGLKLELALFPLLVLIERVGPIGVVELSGWVGRDYTTVSRQTGRLQELGLIERRACSRDARVREATITPLGKVATDAVDAARERVFLAMFSGWQARDFDDLVRLMRKLADGISSIAPAIGDHPFAS